MTLIETEVAAPRIKFNDLTVIAERGELTRDNSLQRDIEIASHIYTHSIRDFQLGCGETLKNARVGFTVIATEGGKLIDLTRFSDPISVLNRPVINIAPALTGSARAYLPSEAKASQGDGWGKNWFGTGDTALAGSGIPFIDTDRFTVVCFDHFAGNGSASTTSAQEISPNLRSKVRLSDGVRLVSQALEEMGVTHLHAVIGGSIGGGQAFEWLFQDRIKVDKIFDISGSAAQTREARQFFEIHADLLKDGFNQAGGRDRVLQKFELNFAEWLRDEQSKEKKPPTPFELAVEFVRDEIARLSPDGESAERRLAVARYVGFLRFVPPDFYDGKIKRCGGLEGLKEWLTYEGAKLCSRFTPEALYCLSNMNAKAPTFHAEKVAERLRQTNTRLIGYYVIGDTLFPAAEQHGYYEQILAALNIDEQRALLKAYGVEDRRNGHDHFLTENFTKTEIVRELRRELLSA